MTDAYVQYSRVHEVWQAHSPQGELLGQWPPGQDGYYAAHLAALTYADPALGAAVAGLAQRWPNLRRPAWKAATLLRAEQVLTAPQGSTDLAAVRSQARAYTTYRLTEHLACTCPSYAGGDLLGPAGAILCKHLLAYLFLSYLGRPLTPRPTPAALWKEARRLLQDQMTRGTYQALLLRAELLPERSHDLCFTIAVPWSSSLGWLRSPRWQARLHGILTPLVGQPIDLCLVLASALAPPLPLPSSPTRKQVL